MELPQGKLQRAAPRKCPSNTRDLGMMDELARYQVIHEMNKNQERNEFDNLD